MKQKHGQVQVEDVTFLPQNIVDAADKALDEVLAEDFMLRLAYAASAQDRSK